MLAVLGYALMQRETLSISWLALHHATLPKASDWSSLLLQSLSPTSSVAEVAAAIGALLSNSPDETARAERVSIVFEALSSSGQLQSSFSLCNAAAQRPSLRDLAENCHGFSLAIHIIYCSTCAIMSTN